MECLKPRKLVRARDVVKSKGSMRKGENMKVEAPIIESLTFLTKVYDGINKQITSTKNRIAHLGNIALKTGRKVYWDAEKGKFFNDDKANELIKAHYRAPWKLPSV